MKSIIDDTKNKYEKCIVIDQTGNVIFTKTGEESRITFNKEESKMITGSKLFIHNHPGSSSFSEADVFITLKLDMSEIRAIAPKSIYGNGFYYIKPTLPKGSNKIEFLIDFESELKSESNKIADRMWEQINRGEIDIDTANKMHYDKLWSKIAKKYGWDYGFKKRT